MKTTYCTYPCKQYSITGHLWWQSFNKSAILLGLLKVMLYEKYFKRLLLMKVFQARGSSLCLQPYGQPITTVLCFMPPRPQDWIRWTTPSRTLDATTTWQKPLTRSISIIFLMAWKTKCGQTECKSMMT